MPNNNSSNPKGTHVFTDSKGSKRADSGSGSRPSSSSPKPTDPPPIKPSKPQTTQSDPQKSDNRGQKSQGPSQQSSDAQMQQSAGAPPTPKLPQNSDSYDTWDDFGGFGGLGNGLGGGPRGGGYGYSQQREQQSPQKRLTPEERVQMIEKVYQEILSRKPDTRDINYYKYSTLDEDQIRKQLLTSAEHKDMVKKGREYEKLKEHSEQMETRVRMLEGQLQDHVEEFRELSNLLQEKNRLITEFRQGHTTAMPTPPPGPISDENTAQPVPADSNLGGTYQPDPPAQTPQPHTSEVQPPSEPPPSSQTESTPSFESSPPDPDLSQPSLKGEPAPQPEPQSQNQVEPAQPIFTTDTAPPPPPEPNASDVDNTPPEIPEGTTGNKIKKVISSIF